MKELTDLLPIGSVVILKEYTEPLMIIQNRKIIEDDKEYLYVGEPFPIGMDIPLHRRANSVFTGVSLPLPSAQLSGTTA